MEKRGTVVTVRFTVITFRYHDGRPADRDHVARLELTATTLPTETDLETWFVNLIPHEHREDRTALEIDLDDSKITATIDGKTRRVSLRENSDDNRYIPTWPLPVLPGQEIWVRRICSSCQDTVIANEAYDLGTGPCPECKERERLQAEKAGRDISGPPPQTVRITTVSAPSSPRPWDRVYHPVLEEIVASTLTDLRIACPYEARDTERVLRWMKGHPLHRFDLDTFVDAVNRQVALLP